MDHARQAAKNLHIEDLPLLIPPHPLYDLTPEQVRELARIAYPALIEQLTSQAKLAPIARIDYVRPKDRNDAVRRTGARQSDGT